MKKTEKVEEAKKPRVKLIGENGNVFNVIGRTYQALVKAGMKKKAEEFKEKAVSSESYDCVLNLAMEYCEVY